MDVVDKRDEAIKQISIKDKIDICIDNNLLTDELLNSLIFESDVTLDDLINIYGLPF